MEYTELALLLVNFVYKTLCRTDWPTNQPTQRTPCNRVLPEKLIGSHLITKFPVFMEPERFISAFTSSHHLSLSWNQTYLVHANPPHVLKIHSNIILHLCLGLESGLSIRSPHQNHACTSPISHICHIPHAPSVEQWFKNNQDSQKKLMQLQFAN
jgi:hypothetical protein